MNLSNHSYFDLSGSGTREIYNQRLQVFSDYFAVIDDERMPTGEKRSVKGTGLDFRTATELGARLTSEDPQILAAEGLDHSWLFDDTAGSKPAARLEDPLSGRVMEVFTTMPAMQIFTPNFPEAGESGKNGAQYKGRAAICFETNFVPNALACPAFASPLLRAEQIYNHKTSFKFSVK